MDGHWRRLRQLLELPMKTNSDLYFDQPAGATPDNTPTI
jgi:hypothetical protein